MSQIKLSEISTRAPKGLDKDDTKQERKRLASEIGEMARIFHARSEKSLLVVLQGMDASGKNGVTRKVFRAVSPVLCSSFNFKKPTDREMAHDFLWRVHKVVPQKGRIRIFNRSHYEDVLIQRVHQWITEEHAEKRIQAINDFERLLTFDNNTVILKFYLHLSKERQREKLMERIELQEDNWKHNPGDWEQRPHWDEYRRCYEEVLNKSEIPWHIVPADQKWYRDYFVAKTVHDFLASLPQEWPDIDVVMPEKHLLEGK